MAAHIARYRETTNDLRSARCHRNSDRTRGLAAPALQAPGRVCRLRRGRDFEGRPGGGAGRGRARFDRAHGGDRLAHRLRRRAALVELRDLSDHRHTGGDGPCRPSGGRRPVFRHLRRRSQPPAAAAHRRPVPLQELRRRFPQALDQVRDQADEAGGHRALHAGAALSPRRGDRGLLARGLRGRPDRRVREGRARRLRCRRRQGLNRLHRRPALLPQRFAQPLDRPRDASPLHLSHQRRARPLHGGGTGEHRHPHLPRRRLRFRAQRRCALQRPAAEHVPVECRLLHDPVQERAEPGAGLQGHRGQHPNRRERRHADGLYRRRQPAEPAGRIARGGVRAARRGRQSPAEGADRLNRRLRLLALQHRREAQPRLAGLRPRRGLPEDRVRIKGTQMAAEKLGIH